MPQAPPPPLKAQRGKCNKKGKGKGTEKKRAIGEVEGAAATLQRFSVPPEVVEIVEGDDNQKGMEVGLGRKRARQGKENEPPANSSRVAAPPESSQESAHLPEEGMSGTCSEFPDFAFLGMNEVWCDTCGQKCNLDRVRVKAKTNGTWQCKNCDTTYQQVNRLNGDPTAATAEFYAAAAGKGMEETKRLWEHHANKYRVRENL